MRKPYPSDLTDEQWDVLAPPLPPAKPGGRPRAVNLREAVNGILYTLRSGCAWRMLPNDLHPWQTVYKYFRKWTADGTFAWPGRCLWLSKDYEALPEITEAWVNTAMTHLMLRRLKPS